jgi:plasmid stability protein
VVLGRRHPFRIRYAASMPTITLKNVPAKLHARLKAQAKQHKRSLNPEAIVCIELAIRSEHPDPERFLVEARELRDRIAASGPPPSSQKFVRQAIDEGRE